MIDDIKWVYRHTDYLNVLEWEYIKWKMSDIHRHVLEWEYSKVYRHTDIA